MLMFLFRQKSLRWGATMLVLLHIQCAMMLAGEDESNPYVSNIRVERQAKISVFIEYDLEGSTDDLYSVSLLIKSAADSSYSFQPLNVIGDIGTNIRPGKNKRISWRTTDEYPPILATTDVRFIVQAIPPESSGSNTELFIAGGAVAVGIALAIVFLSSNKAVPGQVTSSFPAPPGHP